MLQQVRFQNYKALADVTIDLERLTVLVGPNASGKSSVLKAIFDMSRLSEPQFLEEAEPLGRPGIIFGEAEQFNALRTMRCS